MWNLIKMIQKNLYNRNKLKDFETIFPKRKHGGGRDKLGGGELTDIYTLLCIK